MESQNERILVDLKKGRLIDPGYALTHYGCARLASRIYELRQAGHQIMKASRSFKNRAGKIGYVAVYWIPISEWSEL